MVNENLLELFNACAMHQNECAVSMQVYSGVDIECDFFDHKLTFCCYDSSNRVHVMYYNRPTLRTDYKVMFEFDVDLLGCAMYTDNVMFIMFMYGDAKYRVVYDFTEHKFVTQLIYSDETDDDILDFDDDYTDDFNTLYNHVVGEYDDNIKCLHELYKKYHS